MQAGGDDALDKLEKKRAKKREKKARQKATKAKSKTNQAGGAAPLTVPVDDSSDEDDGVSDFGETVSLTAEIRRILKGYDSTTILKELVQNVRQSTS